MLSGGCNLDIVDVAAASRMAPRAERVREACEGGTDSANDLPGFPQPFAGSLWRSYALHLVKRPYNLTDGVATLSSWHSRQLAAFGGFVCRQWNAAADGATSGSETWLESFELRLQTVSGHVA